MTTALVTASRRIGLIAPPSRVSQGESESAKQISNCVERVRQHLLGSVSIREYAQQALEELEQAARDAALEGWNGYGARPIQREAYRNARTFIQALPTTVPKPEVGVDPDGEVSIDWLFARGLTLSVSIGARGRLTFVSSIGNRTIEGTEWLDGGIPASILDELTTVAAAARRAGLA